MRLFALATVTFLAATSLACFAAESRWVRLNRSPISTSYLDLHSVLPTSATNYRYTFKTVPVMARAIDEEYEKDDIGYVIVHGELNCSARSYKEGNVEIFSSTGSKMADQPGQQAAFKPAAPDTLENMLVHSICKTPS